MCGGHGPTATSPLFEALLLTMVSAMPVKTVARMRGEHDTRLWRVLHHDVDQTGRASTPRQSPARALFATEGDDAGTAAALLTTSPRMAVRPRRSMRSAST